MPFLPLLFVLLLPLFLVVATPFLLVQRYRVGSARRRARGWVTKINLALMIFSTAFFVWAAALTSMWAPKAFPYSLCGLGVGAALGLLGLFLTRWERTGGTLHYTPNRFLVLLLTSAVALRILYSFWRAWHAWRTTGSSGSWLVQSGAPGSLFIGAIVLGYYVVYAIGVWRGLRRMS